MSGIVRNILLLRNRSTLFKKYSLPQVSLIRNKQDTTISKDRSTTETDNDEDIDDKPIKYSVTKAYNMRANEYRLGEEDEAPWYEMPLILTSITVFLVYFCIMREENDIDRILESDLEGTLSRLREEKLAEQRRVLK